MSGLTYILLGILITILFHNRDQLLNGRKTISRKEYIEQEDAKYKPAPYGSLEAKKEKAKRAFWIGIYAVMSNPIGGIVIFTVVMALFMAILSKLF